MSKRAVIILDRSGSMKSQISDVVGGMEAFFAAQRVENPDLLVTLTTFNTQVRNVYSNRPVSQCTFTRSDYYPSGGTALMDAVGEVVSDIAREKGEKVLVIVLTDGHENSSSRWNKAQIKALIEKKNPKNWQFIFLGVGIDQFDDAVSMGINLGTSTRSYGTFYAAASGVGSSVSTNAWLNNAQLDSLNIETGETPDENGLLTNQSKSATLTP